MKRITISSLLGVLMMVLSTHVLALSPRPAPAQDEPIVITNATVHVGDGTVIENGSIAFADGVITAVGAAVDASVAGRRIDAGGAHVYPGFIIPTTQLGLVEVGAVRATVDTAERGDLNPNVRSLIAYNTDSEYTPTYRFNGVLLAQTTPSSGLLSGTSSVVQLDAWNWEDAAVAIDDAVHMNWPARMSTRFDFATFTLKTEPNKNYDAQVARVTDLFNDAKAYGAAQPQDRNVKLASLQGLFDGSQALFIHASAAKDIVTGVDFAQGMGINRIVVVGSAGLLDAADYLAARDIPVIVNGTHRLPPHDESAIDFYYALPTRLMDAGLLVGMTNPSAMNGRNLPFVAGTAAAYGMGFEAAVQMISLNNARILGIDDRYGSLEAGKSATLFIAAGNALDMRGNVVSHAFIDGRSLDLNGLQQQLFERFRDKYAASSD